MKRITLFTLASSLLIVIHGCYVHIPVIESNNVIPEPEIIHVNELSLAEKLFHICIDKKTLICRCNLNVSINGILLHRLRELKRIEIKKMRVILQDDSPTGDPVLNRCLEQISRQRRNRHLRYWMKALSRSSRIAYENMMAKMKTKKILFENVLTVSIGFLPVKKLPLYYSNIQPMILSQKERLLVLLLGDDPLSANDAFLISLLQANSLGSTLVNLEVTNRIPWPSKAHRAIALSKGQQRMKEMLQSDPIAVAVAKRISRIRHRKDTD